MINNLIMRTKDKCCYQFHTLLKEKEMCRIRNQLYKDPQFRNLNQEYK